MLTEHVKNKNIGSRSLQTSRLLCDVAVNFAKQEVYFYLRFTSILIRFMAIISSLREMYSYREQRSICFSSIIYLTPKLYLYLSFNY